MRFRTTRAAMERMQAESDPACRSCNLPRCSGPSSGPPARCSASPCSPPRCSLVNLIWFRPFSLDLFYEKAFITFVLENPELLTSIGIAEQFGYRRHNAHLDDVSIAKVERDFAQWHGYLADLKAYDLAAQTPEQRLSTRMLTWFIESLLEGERFRFHDYPVSQLFGMQSQTPDFLINQHRIADRRGAEDYLARLGEVGRKFDQVLEGLALREQKGVVPPRFVIERVLAEMRGFAGKPAVDNPLYKNFAAKVEALPELTAADKQALEARCAEAIESGVLPAYRKLIAFFEGQLARSTTDDGVWKLPDGDAYYAYRLRSRDHDADDAAGSARPRPRRGGAHRGGDDGDPRRAGAAAARGDACPGPHAAGQEPALPLSERPTRAARPRSPTTPTMIEDQLARSRTVIGLVPKAPIEVRRVPEFKESRLRRARTTSRPRSTARGPASSTPTCAT